MRPFISLAPAFMKKIALATATTLLMSLAPTAFAAQKNNSANIRVRNSAQSSITSIVTNFVLIIGGKNVNSSSSATGTVSSSNSATTTIVVNQH